MSSRRVTLFECVLLLGVVVGVVLFAFAAGASQMRKAMGVVLDERARPAAPGYYSRDFFPYSWIGPQPVEIASAGLGIAGASAAALASIAIGKRADASAGGRP